MAKANQTSKASTGKTTGAKSRPRKAAGGAASQGGGTETLAADAAGAAAGSANAASGSGGTPASPRQEARSRFNAALEEARAGAAALRADATQRAAALRGEAAERAAAYRTQARSQSEELLAEARAYGEQARGRAGELAVDGKGKVAEALAALGRAVFDTAPTVDERLGARYGEYARSASRSLQDASARIENKSVEELSEDAREFVRKSPGLAVGIAAVSGFLLARLFRGSND